MLEQIVDIAIIIVFEQLYLLMIPCCLQVLKGEANEEERKLATQLRGPLMPVQQSAPKFIARAITDEEKDFKAYNYLRGVSFNFNNNVKNSLFVYAVSIAEIS